MIKLLFTDMDGTLLKENKDMPTSTKEVLSKIAAQGVICGIATGRSLPSLHRDFSDISDKLAYIAENGAIVQYKGEYIYTQAMQRNHVQQIVRKALSLDNVYPILACAMTTYCPKMNDELLAYFQHYYPTIVVANDLYAIDDAVVKVALYCHAHHAEQVFTELDEFADAGLSITVSGVDWVDLAASGVNKGKGIIAFQKAFDITKEETMAFGDYMNDYEMLLNAGESYAMANAHPKIKEISKYIIGSNEDEAVINTLAERFGL